MRTPDKLTRCCQIDSATPNLPSAPLRRPHHFFRGLQSAVSLHALSSIQLLRPIVLFVGLCHAGHRPAMLGAPFAETRAAHVMFTVKIRNRHTILCASGSPCSARCDILISSSEPPLSSFENILLSSTSEFWGDYPKTTIDDVAWKLAARNGVVAGGSRTG